MGLTQELGLFIHWTRREGRREDSDANRLEYLVMRGYESSPLRRRDCKRVISESRRMS